VKVKVKELAEEIGIDPKELLKRLKEAGFDVKRTNSSVNREEVEEFVKNLKKELGIEEDEEGEEFLILDDLGEEVLVVTPEEDEGKSDTVVVMVSDEDGDIEDVKEPREEEKVEEIREEIEEEEVEKEVEEEREREKVEEQPVIIKEVKIEDEQEAPTEDKKEEKVEGRQSQEVDVGGIKVRLAEQTEKKKKKKKKASKARLREAELEDDWMKEDWQSYLEDEKKIKEGQILEDEKVLEEQLEKKISKPQKPQHKQEKTKEKQQEKKKKDSKQPPKPQVDIRELLKKRRARKRKQKLARRQQLEEQELERLIEQEEEDVIYVPPRVTVGQLSQLFDIPLAELSQKLLGLGISSITEKIEYEVVEIIAEELGKKVKLVEISEEELEGEEEDESKLKLRPPVVTVMGHVDHGKTTLLDYIRKTRVAAQEAGGITQHIGAYQVELEDGNKITFIDTPGHEAFTKMRARGAAVTDIVVLVVAADDGVQPQTLEAIDHAMAAEVPIIVAINKIDKPDANPERIKQQLAELGLVPEDWGGDTMCIPISALTGQGVDELLESISLLAELMELKANPDKKASGYVIESYLDKGRGAVATVIVKEGTLRVGDPVVVGTTHGRVRVMLNDRGERVKEAPPSYPVEISGLEDVPEAGERLQVVSSEREARNIATERRKQLEIVRQQKAKMTLDKLLEQLKQVGVERKEAKFLIKGDTDGTVQALKDSLEKLSNEEVSVVVVRAAVGAITEADVDLARASDAIILGFNVRPTGKVTKYAQSQGVTIKTYRIIYDVVEDVKKILQMMVEPEEKEVVLGQAEVREVFKISKVGTVAGLYVTDGVAKRNAKVRVLRDGVVVYTGEIQSLKRFKEDVAEVAAGYECGLKIKDFNDIKKGDIIEFFDIVQERKEIEF